MILFGKSIPWLLVLGAFAGAGMPGDAPAQAWPSKAVRVIVPWPPGGGTDIAARPMVARLSEVLGQQFVVDNRGGANGLIGTEVLAKSAPDGHTLVINTLSAHAINATYYTKLPYDTIRDFAPVSIFTYIGHVLVAHPSFPPNNMKQMVALAKARPGEIVFASFGQASTSHLAGELFRKLTGIKWLHVPYKGGGPAMIDLVAGQVPLHFAGAATAKPYLTNGRIKALGISTLKRSTLLPEVPTIAEVLNLPDYDVTASYGMIAPAATPRVIVDRLYSEIQKAVREPEMKKRFENVGYEVGEAMSPAQTTEWIRREVDKYGRLLREANLRADL